MDWRGVDIRALSIAAASFCFAAFGSTLSLDPIIWNDSTSFIHSATESISSGSIVALNGVGAGYVALLSSVLYAGAGLMTVVFLQHLAWAFAAAYCGYTLARICQTAWAFVPSAFVATYPGIQIYSNIVIADSIYMAALTSALCSFLLSFGEKSQSRLLLKLLTAMFFASLAALFKTQGLAQLLVFGLTSVWMSSRLPRQLVIFNFAVVAMAIITVCAVRGNSVRSTDQTAVLFGPKTLFCFHLDIILSAPSTVPLSISAFGASADRLIEAFRRDLATKSDHFPTLGFNADVCQFDKNVDEMATSAQPRGVEGVAAWYQSVFVAAVIQCPYCYLRKLVSQVAYGLKMSVPPHGLGSKLTTDSERANISQRLLAQSGLSQSGIARPAGKAIAAPFFSQLDSRAVVFSYRVLSIAAAFALIGALLLMLSARWRKHPLVPSAAMSSLVWFCQVGVVAMTHTLDVWRYIVPVVPACVVTCTLVAIVSCGVLKQKTAVSA